MKKSKLFGLLMGALGFCISFNGCTRLEDVPARKLKPEKDISDFYPGGTAPRPQIIHLYNDTVYILSTPVSIESGEQLVIDGGTLIKANEATSPSLTIKPGGTIQAKGTVSEPIVFTLNKRPGDQKNNWGGLFISGKSYNNDVVNPTADPDDASGTFQYVRIEFASLTLQSVGRGTTIDHVMVSYAGEINQAPPNPAFNILGGTFNSRYLVSYACAGPADFYITNGYEGRLQFMLGFRHPFFGKTGITPPGSISGLLVENHPFRGGDARPFSNPFISNMSLIGPGLYNGLSPFYTDTTSIKSSAFIATRSTCFRIRNSCLFNYASGAYHLDDVGTAENIVAGNGELANSLFHSNYSNRTFILTPGVFPPYNSGDFRNYMLQPSFNNKVLATAGDFGLAKIFDYNDLQNVPDAGSVLLNTTTDFSGPVFSSFFEKVTFKGAVGTDNWLRSWTNFIPLKTNYNFP